MAEKQQGSSNVPPQLQGHEFQPGQSGNPGGKAKGAISLVGLLREHMAEVPEDERFADGGKNRARLFIEQTLRLAMSPKGTAADRKLVWEYLEGQAKKSVEVANKDGEAFQVQTCDDPEHYAEVMRILAEVAGLEDGDDDE